MSHQADGVAPDGVVWDVKITGDPHAFFHCGLGFGFTNEMWDAVSPVLGEYLDTWNVVLQDGDRSIQGVASRARIMFEDAIDEAASDVRYMEMSAGHRICRGAYKALVFDPAALDAARVFQTRQSGGPPG